jgi:hypothetical protein
MGVIGRLGVALLARCAWSLAVWPGRETRANDFALGIFALDILQLYRTAFHQPRTDASSFAPNSKFIRKVKNSWWGCSRMRMSSLLRHERIRP